MLNVWEISLNDYIEIMEEAIVLGKERGKVAGENIETEFFEVAKKRGFLDKIKHLGTTTMDKDLLIGNIREETKLKILDLTKKKEE